VRNVNFIKIQDLEVKVEYKKIRNLNLKVKANKEITLSSPIRISSQEIESFILSKLNWIRDSLEKFEKATPQGFYLYGRKFELQFIHKPERIPHFEISENNFFMYVHDGVAEKTRERLLNKYLEHLLEEVTREFFEKWENSLNVSKNSLIIKKMKGRWGYCNTRTKEICLNTNLIQKDKTFIEYVVLHELCHILVPNHGPNFKRLLNQNMPNWKKISKNHSI
jgi:predicted metal-dependent hydrolase